MAHRKHQRCAEVRSWLLEANEQRRYGVIPQWSEHVATCASCRGAILLVAQELVGRPKSAHTYVTCGMCQRDLAAYIDLAQVRGERVAAHRYPHVWWHLWTCAECAETYQLTTMLVEAEAFGELPPLWSKATKSMPPPSFSTRLQPLNMSLSRPLLALIFSQQPHLGRLRGIEDEIVLSDDELENYSLHVAVSHLQETTCCLRVTTAPPTTGQVTVALDDHSFCSALDSQGIARICDFPLSLLCSNSGSDVVITIQAESGDMVC